MINAMIKNDKMIRKMIKMIKNDKMMNDEMISMIR